MTFSDRANAQQVFRKLAHCFTTGRALAMTLPSGLCYLHDILQPTDPQLLPFAAEMTERYFRPKPGEIFLLNDPYSGGSDLSQITFVGCLATEYLLLSRVDLKPQLKFVKTIDEEGVRIPPTPVILNDSLNEELLNSIRQHPLAPVDFDPYVSLHLEVFRKHLNSLQNSKTFSDLLKLEGFFSNAFGLALDSWRERLRDLPNAEATAEIVLREALRVRLKMLVRNGEVTFNFAGTTAAQDWALTDRATAGACLSALVRLLHWHGPVHSQFFNLIKVLTPTNSLVNAKFPMALGFGLRDGVGLINLLVKRCLSQIDKSVNTAEAHPSQCAISLTFADGSVLYDTTEPGQPATTERPGMAGRSVSSHRKIQPSIERLEELFPVRMQLLSLRQNSGGRGQYSGGMGTIKVMQLLKSATLRWQFLQYQDKVEGSHGGHAGSPPIFSILKHGQTEQTTLGSHGEMPLEAFDQVIVQSAGGGGFGVPEDGAS